MSRSLPETTLRQRPIRESVAAATSGKVGLSSPSALGLNATNDSDDDPPCAASRRARQPGTSMVDCARDQTPLRLSVTMPTIQSGTRYA